MKKALVVFMVMFCVCVLLYLYLAKPYESLREVRRGEAAVTFFAEYVNVTGDPNCAKLYVTNTELNTVGQLAVFPAVADGLPAPDDGSYAYHGNRFKITGFPYDWIRSNSITGFEQRAPSRRVDVVKWELIAPYSIWVSSDDETVAAGSEIVQEPLINQLQNIDVPISEFRMSNYIDCLAE